MHLHRFEPTGALYGITEKSAIEILMNNGAGPNSVVSVTKKEFGSLLEYVDYTCELNSHIYSYDDSAVIVEIDGEIVYASGKNGKVWSKYVSRAKFPSKVVTKFFKKDFSNLPAITGIQGTSGVRAAVVNTIRQNQSLNKIESNQLKIVAEAIDECLTTVTKALNDCRCDPK